MKRQPKGIRGGAAVLLVLLLLPMLLSALSGCAGPREFVLPTRTLPENAEVRKYASFRYKIYDDDTVILTEYKAEDGDIVIPDTIEGRKVVALVDSMFYQNKNLTSLKLGKYVESIGDQCFTQCSNLRFVTLNEVLWSIGEFAFDGTPWLENLVDPTRGNGQTGSAETGSDGTDTVAETEPEKRDPADDFIIVGDGVLLRYVGEDKNIVLPDTVRHVADAFLMSDIISVRMSDSVYTIGDFSFAFCASLATVEFSPNILSIGEGAFYGCSSLPSVQFPEKLETIGHSAFYECTTLSSVRLNETLRLLEDYVFFNCGQLRMIYLPRSLTSIGQYAFGGCASMETVFYAGDEAAYKSISNDTTNYPILDALIVYNATSGG